MRTSVIVVVLAAFAAFAGAEEREKSGRDTGHVHGRASRGDTLTAAATGQTQGGGATWESAPAPTPDLTPRRVAFREEAPRSLGDSPLAGALKGIRALAMKEGEARVVLPTGERVLRPGDAIGSDVVKSVEPGRLVLARTSPELGEAIVIVTFDAQGRGRVRVFASRDPIARVPPEVK